MSPTSTSTAEKAASPDEALLRAVREAGLPAALHEGTCDAPGTVVTLLTNATAAVGERRG